MHTPVMNSLSHGLFRFVANCLYEIDEMLSVFVLGSPWSKGIPQKVEISFWMIFPAVIVFAVDNPGFVRMQF